MGAGREEDDAGFAGGVGRKLGEGGPDLAEEAGEAVDAMVSENSSGRMREVTSRLASA